MGRAVGVDYGLRRIGVALSDPRKIIATPFGTIETAKQPKETVLRLLQALSGHEIDLFVVGIPYRLKGTFGEIEPEIRRFIAALEEAQKAPVFTLDERLTTAQAERSLREGGMRRKERAKVVDKVSAALLLQSYLERMQIDR